MEQLLRTDYHLANINLLSWVFCSFEEQANALFIHNLIHRYYCIALILRMIVEKKTFCLFLILFRFDIMKLENKQKRISKAKASNETGRGETVRLKRFDDRTNPVKIVILERCVRCKFHVC